MNLSKREMTILLLTLTVVGLLLADRMLISPVLAYRQTLAMEVDSLTDVLAHDRRLIRQGVKEQKRWKKMMLAGLPSTASEADSRTLAAINQWANETGLELVSVKPEYQRSDEILVPVIFRVSATGNIQSIAKFIWQVETAAMPVCVEGMQISQHTKSKGSLSLQMGLSSLYRQPIKKEASR